MSDYFPDYIIDQVRQASDIIDVLSEFLPLKKRGRNWLCKCPFHNEKTPSFSVSQDKQIYHCFGCGKGGNVFTFLMEHEQMSFPEAVKFLAKRANIPLPEPKRDAKTSEKYARLYYANEQAADFFHQQLLNHRDGEKVLAYLHETRGITDESISEFNIGFAPDGWDNLLTFSKSKQISIDELRDAGLIIRRESGDGFYDRFRQRLVFPIFDLSRRPIAFGARALSSRDTIKYLNSPETPLYNKSRVLYGLSHTRSEIRSSREALIVEGYMDLVGIYQAGIQNAVAVSGTSFTKEHALLLKRYADTVNLLFDADPAGQSAAERCAEHLFSVGLDVRVILLPEGHDPDSYVREEGSDSLKERISESLSYFEFVERVADPPFKERGRAGQQMLLKSQLRLVGLAPDDVMKALMLKELSDIYGITEDMLRSAMPKTERRPVEARPVTYRVDTNRPQLERSVLVLLVSHPSLLQTSENLPEADWFENAEYRDLYAQAVKSIEDGNEPDFAAMVGKAETESIRKELTALLIEDNDVSDWETAFGEFVQKLKAAYRDKKIRQLSTELAQAEESGNEATVKSLIETINELRNEK